MRLNKNQILQTIDKDFKANAFLFISYSSTKIIIVHSGPILLWHVVTGRDYDF